MRNLSIPCFLQTDGGERNGDCQLVSMGETVHVLLPVHNRRALTQRFLNCLREQSYPHIRLLVVDDGSSDGTAEMIRAEYSGAVVLRESGDLWWAGSLQRGIDHLAEDGIADNDIVLMANDDTTFDREFVARAARLLGDHPRSLLCARMLDPQSEHAQESGVHANLWRFTFRIAKAPHEINCLPTRGLFLRWVDVRSIGGFHPRLLPHYWSDYEYTLRAHRLGFRCMTDASVVLRANLQSTGYRDLDRLVGWDFLRQLFSVKTPLNPLYRSVFVCLAAPGLLKFLGLLNVWARALPRIVWQGLAHRPFPRAIVSPGRNGRD